MKTQLPLLVKQEKTNVRRFHLGEQGWKRLLALGCCLLALLLAIDYQNPQPGLITRYWLPLIQK